MRAEYATSAVQKTLSLFAQCGQIADGPRPARNPSFSDRRRRRRGGHISLSRSLKVFAQNGDDTTLHFRIRRSMYVQGKRGLSGDFLCYVLSCCTALEIVSSFCLYPPALGSCNPGDSAQNASRCPSMLQHVGRTLA